MNAIEVWDGSKYLRMPGTPGPQSFAQVGGTEPVPRGVGDVWVDTEQPLLQQWDDDWQYPVLLNGWRDQNAGQYGPVRYRKMPGGMVLLDGLVTGGSLGATSSVAVFTLPVGYRVDERLAICGNSSPGNTHTRINIDPGNFVSILLGNTAWISLHCAWNAEA